MTDLERKVRHHRTVEVDRPSISLMKNAIPPKSKVSVYRSPVVWSGPQARHHIPDPVAERAQWLSLVSRETPRCRCPIDPFHPGIHGKLVRLWEMKPVRTIPIFGVIVERSQRLADPKPVIRSSRLLRLTFYALNDGHMDIVAARLSAFQLRR